MKILLLTTYLMAKDNTFSLISRRQGICPQTLIQYFTGDPVQHNKARRRNESHTNLRVEK